MIGKIGERFFATCLVLLSTCAANADETSDKAFYSGFELLKVKKWDQAIAMFEQGLKIDPHNATALFYLGEAHSGAGHPKRARSNWQKALATAPDSEWAPQAKKRLAVNSPPAIQTMNSGDAPHEKVHLICSKLDGDGSELAEPWFYRNNGVYDNQDNQITIGRDIVEDDKVVMLGIYTNFAARSTLNRYTGILIREICSKDISDITSRPVNWNTWCVGEYTYYGKYECKQATSRKY